MTPGLSNREKAAVRERFAAGQATREELLAAETASYHLARHLHLLRHRQFQPGAARGDGPATARRLLRESRHAPARRADRGGDRSRAGDDRAGRDYRPLGRIVDERAIVNAVVALIATGGSTNHTIHWLAVARAAGIELHWEDIDELAQHVPLLARVYPNGAADVNRFAAAGGPAFVFRELIDGGWMHADIEGIVEGGMRAWTREPRFDGETLDYVPAVAESADEDVVRPLSRPFEASGGLRMVTGNLGRAIVKMSALPSEQRRIEAPAVVVDNPQALNRLHAAGALPQDFIAVVRFQGPRANGMPEMHSLTPLLGMLQNQGRRVALVTDGRLSGASGKVLSAIHVTPEAAGGGALARLRQGDLLRLDGEAGTLEALVDAAEFAARTPDRDSTPPAQDLGRNLFAGNRAACTPADQGALSISCGPLLPERHGEQDEDAEYALGDEAEAAAAPHEAKDA
jgi:phosphogluconate dehydratase